MHLFQTQLKTWFLFLYSQDLHCTLWDPEGFGLITECGQGPIDTMSPDLVAFVE